MEGLRKGEFSGCACCGGWEGFIRAVMVDDR